MTRSPSHICKTRDLIQEGLRPLTADCYLEPVSDRAAHLSLTTSQAKDRVALAAIEMLPRKADPADSVAYHQIRMARSGRVRRIRRRVSWVPSCLRPLPSPGIGILANMARAAILMILCVSPALSRRTQDCLESQTRLRRIIPLAGDLPDRQIAQIPGKAQMGDEHHRPRADSTNAEP